MARPQTSGAQPTSGAPARTTEKPKARNVKVRALQMGYHGLVRRRPGTVFDFKLEDGKKLPSWVTRVEGKAAEQSDAEPATSDAGTRGTDVEVI